MSDPDSEEALLKALRKMEADKQAGFRAEACAAESDLRHRIEDGLQVKAQEDISDPPDRRTSGVTRSFEDAKTFQTAGSLVGSYKLLEQIGEGGCGVVYLAEQTEPVHRRVALKLIKPGTDTRQVLARFEAERQALALMDHPNIAKVLEAGATDSGRPFFVMELVKGIRITEYCDENKLDTSHRLNLFIQVCQAIQHAHQKGIIHRDIKPSNILVSDHNGAPVPKIIDFGIAKAVSDQPLTNKTLFTALEQFIGTPAYMSPEQAKLSGLDVDTRSDIYSLGVLLYELLTGKTPFDSQRLFDAGLDEVRRIILEEDPPRPSTKLTTLTANEQTSIALRRQSQPVKLINILRGDLDWIAMRALEKDRTRRYATANGLAADVERYLSSEPVEARPPTATYRLAKFLRRHQVATLATVAFAILLLSALGLTLYMLDKEANAHRLAVREAQKSKELAKFLQEMFNSPMSEDVTNYDTSIIVALADRAALHIEGLRSEPELEADLRNTLGRLYRFGVDDAKAKLMLEEALRLRQEVFGSNSLPVAESMCELASVLGVLGFTGLNSTPPPAEAGAATINSTANLAKAEALAVTSLAIRRRLVGENSVEVVDSLNTLGFIRNWRGDFDGCLKTYEEEFAILQRLKDLSPPIRSHACGSAISVASHEERRGNFPEAEKWLLRALEYSKRPGEETMCASCVSRLATLYRNQTNFLAAANLLQNTLAAC